MIKDKVAIITGASSGIGFATALALAKAGAKVAIGARRADRLEDLAKRISADGGEVFYQKLDVTQRSECENFAKAVLNKWGSIDILVNNAGLMPLSFFKSLKIDEWDRMVDVNIKGVLYSTAAVITHMKEKKSGHIVNLSSVAGRIVFPAGSVYCATKHAVDAITKGLRMDVVDKNIRVSTVDPGAVETNFSNVRFSGDKERAKSMYKGIIPLIAEDVAEAVLFCATRPPHANIAEIIMMPTQQASALVFHREEK